MDPDDAVDLLEELSEAEQKDLLSHISHEEATVLSDLLAYPPGYGPEG